MRKSIGVMTCQQILKLLQPPRSSRGLCSSRGNGTSLHSGQRKVKKTHQGSKYLVPTPELFHGQWGSFDTRRGQVQPLNPKDNSRPFFFYKILSS